MIGQMLGGLVVGVICAVIAFAIPPVLGILFLLAVANLAWKKL